MFLCIRLTSGAGSWLSILGSRAECLVLTQILYVWKCTYLYTEWLIFISIECHIIHKNLSTVYDTMVSINIIFTTWKHYSSRHLSILNLPHWWKSWSSYSKDVFFIHMYTSMMVSLEYWRIEILYLVIWLIMLNLSQKKFFSIYISQTWFASHNPDSASYY